MGQGMVNVCEFVFLSVYFIQFMFALINQSYMLLFRLERNWFVLSCHCLFLPNFQILLENN